MKNWRRVLAVGLMSFFISCGQTPLPAQEIQTESLEPRRVSGEMIYEEGFPSGEVFFVRSRPQEEALDYILQNVVGLSEYNQLGEAYNQVLKDLDAETLAHESTKNLLWGTWIGVTLTGLVSIGIAWLVGGLSGS